MAPDIHRRAIALPLVLWSIALLGGLVVLLAGVVGDWLESESRAERRFVARQMALSGVALGLNPAVKPGDPLLRRGSPDGEGFEVRLENEAAKIKLKTYLSSTCLSTMLKNLAIFGKTGRIIPRPV